MKGQKTKERSNLKKHQDYVHTRLDSFCAGIVWTVQPRGAQVLHTHWTSFRCVWPTGFGALKSSPHPWISSSMDSSLIHFLYGPNTCSHCIKVLKRTYPICHTPFSRLARELCSFTEIARKSQLLYVNRSLIRYGLRQRCTVYSLSRTWVSSWLVDKLYAQLGPGSRSLVYE